MMEDIVDMVLALDKADSGELQIDWPSSGFPFHWAVRWKAGEVEVHAQARPEPGAVDLSARDRVRVPREAFVRAWRVLLSTILSSLESAGYTNLQLEGMNRLRTAAVNKWVPANE